MLKDNLRACREERGLSQQQLADELHVVRQTVSKWERGTSVPDADLLVALARVFGTTPNALLGPSASADTGPSSALETGLLKEKVTQQDRMERVYRRTIAVMAVLCAAALAIAIIFSLGHQAGRFADGFEHGFKLQGTWQTLQENGEPLYASFGFSKADEGVWQIADFAADAPVNGYFETTGDPNFFLLQNEQGEEVGWANVAFTSSFAGHIDGLAYVQYGEACYRVAKMDNMVVHYDKDFAGSTGTVVDRYPELMEEGVEGADDWLKEWFTK